VEQPEQDPVRALVARSAQSCLDDLFRSGQAPRPEPVLRSSAGWTVLVVAYPTPDGFPALQLSDCDQDCLSLLAQARSPLPAVRIRRELEERGLGVWGIATVKRSLARLKRLRLVGNSRRSPRGYSLEENAPLLHRLARG
jgi:hypothetical protein